MKMAFILLAGSALAVPSLSTQALAQEAPRDASGVDEIIVTAQRREESLLDVPLSIQAASGEQLETRGIRDLTSLQFTTPGLLAQTVTGFTQIYLRGIGNAIFLGADPSVATFVDDVPRIYGSMADNLVDVERIEILKGAQGGLYGRNATGGVINIITNKPSTEEVHGNLLASYGEHRTFRAAGFLNIPLNENVALSLSGERASHSAYVKNLAPLNPYSAANFPTGSFLGAPQQTADFFNSSTDHPALSDQDFWATRAKLLIKPSDNVEITLAADYYDKADTAGSGIANLTPAITQASLEAFFGALGIDAALPAGFVKGQDGKFTATAGFPLTNNIREYGVSGTVVWHGPRFDLTSITAYRNQHTKVLGDVNTSSVPAALLDIMFDKHFTYQELRAVSTFDGPLRLLGGASYLENSLSGRTIVSLLHPQFNAGNGAVRDKVKNWSVYGEASYDFTDHLTLTASGRYIHETNTADFTLPVVASARTVQKKFVPSATVSYKLDDGSMYLRWARGFKTGGINLSTAASYFPNPDDGSLFGPETVDTFEAGYKRALLDRKLQLTAAVFYNDYKNLQVDTKPRPAFPQITTAIINAKSARTWGVEVSALWRATQPLTFGASVGYLNAKYKDFSLTGRTALEDFDRSGFQMTAAPKWQASFTADLDQPISDDLRVVGNVLVSHVSRVIFMYSPQPGVIPDAVGPGYWLTNLRLGIKTADDRYGFSVVADNIFDKGYYIYGQSGPGGTVGNWGNPRIVRGEVTVKF